MKSILSRFKSAPTRSSSAPPPTSGNKNDKDGSGPVPPKEKERRGSVFRAKPTPPKPPLLHSPTRNVVSAGDGKVLAAESAPPTQTSYLMPPNRPQSAQRHPSPSAFRSVSEDVNAPAPDGTVPRRRTVSASGERKVTFKSPPGTPETSTILDLPLEPLPTLGPPFELEVHKDNSLKPPGSMRGISRSRTPLVGGGDSTPGSRVQSPPTIPTFPRPSSSRKSSLPSPPLSARHPSPRKSHPSPLPHSQSLPYSTLHPSSSSRMFSPTPSSTSINTVDSIQSYLPMANTWSEMADPDLVANLGPQERNRQEVLWEIVSSEERYVNDLHDIHDLFIKNLLPDSSPVLELPDAKDMFRDRDSYGPFMSTLNRQLSPSSPTFSTHTAWTGGTYESSANLPIAARYASSISKGHTSPHGNGSGGVRSPSGSSSSTAPPVTPSEDNLAFGAGLGVVFPSQSNARLTAYNTLTNGGPGLTPGQGGRVSRKSSMVEMKHHSLPPLSRASSALNGGGTVRGNSRLSYHPPSTPQSGRLQKPRQSPIPPLDLHTSKLRLVLPKDLELVLQALVKILQGHTKLIKSLKMRYDDQFPLVRSLADIFTDHQSLFKEYRAYVLHLEKALAQIEEAPGFYDPLNPTKRQSKNISPELIHFSKHLHALSLLPPMHALPPLSICLSKPFNRLLHYPLMFQNLLFNTDPTLKEYERAMGMVEEVEEVVRKLEDEKVGWEDRETTRDGWGRIGGLDGDKVLMAPKPNRLLISETSLMSIPGATAKLAAHKSLKDRTLRGKKSVKRLSEILKGGPAELWVVRFTDVSLLCEKKGTTTLPMSSLQNPEGMANEKDWREKDRDKKGRARRGRDRNMYRFLRVWEWHLDEENGSPESARAPTPPSRSPLATIPDITPRKPTPNVTSQTRPSPPTYTAPQRLTPSKVKSLNNLYNAERQGTKDIDAETSFSEEGESVMSFAFRDDMLYPSKRRVKPVPRMNTGATGSASGRTGTTTLRVKPKDPSMGGKAGASRMSTAPPRRSIVPSEMQTAKFSNRLRPLSSDGPLGPPTAGKARSSLPPAMLRSYSVASGATVVTIPTLGDREDTVRQQKSVTQPRTAWSASTQGTNKRASTPASTASATASPTGTIRRAMSPTASVGQGRGRASLPPPTAKVSAATTARRAREASVSGGASRGTLPKTASPTTSTFKQSNPPRTTTPKPTSASISPRTTATPKSRAPPSSTTTKRAPGLRNMQSTDSGLAEVWRQYGNVDVDRLGESTPKKKTAEVGGGETPLRKSAGAANGSGKTPGSTAGSPRSSMGTTKKAGSTIAQARTTASAISTASKGGATRTGIASGGAAKKEYSASVRVPVGTVTGQGRKRDLGGKI